ncbi:MAG: hypothetical protein H6560_25600 [Lewinellaceae bacterium]|nr:hypothetical protein [Lewinellaceae bacterium]
MKMITPLLFLAFSLTACQQKPVPSPTSPPRPCETPPDTLLVEGYYSIDSCLVRLNIQPDANGKWCYLPAGKQAFASCPGWDGFIALLDEHQRLFSIESPLRA